MLARWFAVAVLALNAIDMMFFVPAYPFWALTIIAVDVVALYGRCAYGSCANPGRLAPQMPCRPRPEVGSGVIRAIEGHRAPAPKGPRSAAMVTPPGRLAIAAGISLDRPTTCLQDEGGTRDTSEHGGDHVEDPARPGDPPAEAWAAVLRTFMCRRGAGQMRADADEAVRRFAAQSFVTPAPAFLQGIARVLCGDLDGGDASLEDGISVEEEVGAHEDVALALCERSLVAIARSDWGRAEALAGQAAAVLRRAGIDSPGGRARPGRRRRSRSGNRARV